MTSELSEEAALVKGVEILDARRERQVREAGLKKRMRHSMMKEWMFWTGIALCFLNFYPVNLSSVTPLGWLPSAFFILSGMECAAMRREEALLEWLEYQNTKDKPHE